MHPNLPLSLQCRVHFKALFSSFVLIHFPSLCSLLSTQSSTLPRLCPKLPLPSLSPVRTVGVCLSLPFLSETDDQACKNTRRKRCEIGRLQAFLSLMFNLVCLIIVAIDPCRSIGKQFDLSLWRAVSMFCISLCLSFYLSFSLCKRSVMKKKNDDKKPPFLWEAAVCLFVVATLRGIMGGCMHVPGEALGQISDCHLHNTASSEGRKKTSLPQLIVLVF